MGLSQNDFLFAAVVSLILTWLISSLRSYWVKLSNLHEVEIGFKASEASEALQKCYNLFPRELVDFNGSIFKRGMMVRVTTSKNKIIEGKIIGANNQDIICIVTKDFIVAHELRHIEAISLIENV